MNTMGKPLTRGVELKVNYAVFVTGYTSRLPDHANKLINDPNFVSLRKPETILCTKDELWGDRSGRSFNVLDESLSENEAMRIKEFHAEYDLDGTAVMRVNDGDFATALYAYHNTFGSSEDLAYCGCFHGIPESSRLIDHDQLGLVLILQFDCESG